jgi:hypothetical protein
MNFRYILTAVGLFALLLLTILSSIFGWGLQAATLATTMVENPRPDTGRPSGSHFHIWSPFHHQKTVPQDQELKSSPKASH